MNMRRLTGLLAAAALLSQVGLFQACAGELVAGAYWKEWRLLGPFSIQEGAAAPDAAAQKAAFDKDFLSSAGGEAAAAPKAGDKTEVLGQELAWREFSAAGDQVNLAGPDGNHPFSVAYGYLELECAEARSLALGLGSDDGVKLWVNGRLVHTYWGGRPVRPDEDFVAAEFVPGINRILIKAQNMEAGFGWMVRTLDKEALSRILTRGDTVRDLQRARQLLEAGADPNTPRPDGLNAFHMARISGQADFEALLKAKAADAGVPMPDPREVFSLRMDEAAKRAQSAIVVLVAKDGEVVFSKAVGHADIGNQVPATTQTKFRIGSVTKQFVAAAILKLQEEGFLSISDKLSKYFPDFPRGDEVTIRQLLNHTSGIQSFTSKPKFMETVQIAATAKEMVDGMREDPFTFEPGQKWAYNNSGYFLLGEIAAQVAGKPWGELLDELFFTPAGMEASGVYDNHAIYENEAHGYSFDGEREVKALNWDMSRAGGAGALYSTAEDLFRWNEALFGGKLLSRQSTRAAFTGVDTAGSPPRRSEDGAGYGFGWIMRDQRGLRVVEHSGGLHGFQTHLARVPSENLTVVVLVNSGPVEPGRSPSALAVEAIELALWEKMKPAESVKVEASIPVETLDAIAGRYDYGGAVMEVTRDGARLFAQLTGQPKFEIFPKSELEYFWKVVEASVSFTRGADGNITGAVHSQGGSRINVKRLPDLKEVSLTPAQLAELVGKYNYGPAIGVLEITVENGALLGKITGQPQFPLFAKSPSVFFWKVVVAEFEVVRDAGGKIEKLIHRQGGGEIVAPRMEDR